MNNSERARLEHTEATAVADAAIKVFRTLAEPKQRAWALALLMLELEVETPGTMLAVGRLVQHLSGPPEHH